MTAEEYRGYLEQDFGDVDISHMPDMKEYRPDMDKPVLKRREAYLKKVKNPYLVRIGNMKVKVRFANNGVSFEDVFQNMLLNV